MTNGEKLKEVFPNGVLTSINNSYYWGDDILVSKNWWNAEYKEPTTKNNLAQERYQDLIDHFGDEKVAKAILESRKEFKAWLERLRWNVKRVDELARELEQIKGTTKNDKIDCQHTDCNNCVNHKYCDYESTTKNDLGVDCISRQAVLELIADYDLSMGQVVRGIHALPSVTPQEPKIGHWIECMPRGAEEWCYKCSECNFWKYKKTINLSKFKFCPNCAADMREVVEE